MPWAAADRPAFSERQRIASAMRQATRMGLPLDWWDWTETVHALARRARTGIGSGVVRAAVLLPT